LFFDVDGVVDPTSNVSLYLFFCMLQQCMHLF
jgi:hypothetical protein